MMETPPDSLTDGELSDDGLNIDLDSFEPEPKKKSKAVKDLNSSEIEMVDSVAKDLDEKLDAKAAKINLSAVNVKSIIKQVVSNEHVIGMVRQTENPEAESPNIPFEPKLTRAKAKELYQTPPITSLPWLSPMKPSSEVQKLIADELAEDSSGDEYVPAEEESEDDRDSFCNNETDLRSVSPHIPTTKPDSPTEVQWTDDGIFKIPPTQTKEVEEANIALRTRSKLSLSSTPLEVIEEAFIPPDITTDMYDMDCDDDDWRDFLKKFTRPLDEIIKPCEDEEHDPEYNILADEDVDEVDREELRADRAVKVSRKEFNDMLAELFEYANNFEDTFEEINSSISTNNETQPVILFDVPENETLNETQPILYISEDGSVNESQPILFIPDDQNLSVPQDSAVNETQATVSISEAQSINETQMCVPEIPNDTQLILCIPEDNTLVDETLQLQELPPPTCTVTITAIEPSSGSSCDQIKRDHEVLLQQQMRQHIQLLTQNFLLTFEHPEYQDMAPHFKSLLCNFNCLSECKENSFFRALNLDGALQLIQHWETQFQLNTDEVKEMKKYTCRVLHESVTSKAAGIEYIVTFPPLIMETIAKSDVFVYPDLLPIIPFKSSNLFNKKCDIYTTSEDQLIALGLEKFIPDLAQNKRNLTVNGSVKLPAVCKLIREHFTPTKTESRLISHIFHRRKPTSVGNPIKYYFQNERAPVVIHYVWDLNEFKVVPPCKRSKKSLPYQWRQYLYPPSKNQNSTTTTSTSIPPATITKVHKPPAYNKNFANKTSSRRIVQRTPLKPSPAVIHSNKPSTPNQNIVNQCSTPISNPANARKQLEKYFVSPKVSKPVIVNTQLQSLKFNSSIFENSRKTEEKTLGMLPSMPNLCDMLDGSNEETVGKQINNVDTEPDSVPVECDEDEETTEKDNEGDINALMIASSTIRTTNRRGGSGAEKKRAKLQREYLANLAMLTPEDPIYLQEKAQSYAQAYFDKAKERLSPDDYTKFMEVLNNFEENTCNVAGLYKEIESIIGNNHSDLMEEFLTFLTPSQAREMGKLIPYYMLNNMSLFLRKLELYFKDQPAQLRKIYRSLTYLTTCVDVNMERVKTTILPLLKGNSLLTDWFLQIFPCEPPPPSLLKGVWEQIDARREFNPNEDIFETINVPEMEDQYGGPNCICLCHETDDVVFQTRSQHCIPCGIRFFQGRVYIQTGKGLRSANVTFNGNSGVDHNLRLNCLSADKRKRRSDVSPCKQYLSPTKDSHDDTRAAHDSEDDAECTKRKGRVSKSPRKKRVKFRDVNEKARKREPTEVLPEATIDVSDGRLLENITVSNDKIDSETLIDFEDCISRISKPVTEDTGEWDCNASIESVEVRKSPEHSAESESEFCEESSQDNINTETDDSAEELESLSNSPVHSENSNSNHADQELTWTRDEDKIILETLQKEGGNDEAFIHISDILGNRSVTQIKERFQTLMNLLKKMTSRAEVNS